MNPAVPETKGGVGASFKGTAQYLLHDKDADTAGRVMWSETINMATDDPDSAWRVMAATAMDAQRLQREHHEATQASLPEDQRTAYKAPKRAFNHVFHYALTWHPDDAGMLSRDVLLREAKGSLRALGADDLQAMIVCHHDTDHPHVHVMINRVHPETGKIVPVNGNAQRKLSAYALKRDKEMGIDRSPKRQENADKRKENIPYQADKRVPRHIYDQQKAVREAASQAPDRAAAIRKEQSVKDHALAGQERAMKDSHRNQAAELSRDHKFRKAMINKDADDAKKKVKKQLSKSHAAKLDHLTREAKAEMVDLAKQEKTRLGKLGARLSAIGKSWKVSQAESFAGRVASTFEGIGSAGYAKQVLAKVHESRREAAGARYRSELRREASQIEKTRQGAISANYARYQTAYTQMKTVHANDKAQMAEQWRSRDTERASTWQKFGKSIDLGRQFKDAVTPAPQKAAKSDEGKAPKPEKTRGRERQ